ncbi:MAG: hypothetical protein QG673_1243 [Pseudomonadota bacterium]|nr:hypothetical protein [Pseudomonadota bacterium]
MIKNIHIKGFKCFDNEKIDFSNLTVITGPNSSGKSSLIQAVLINLNHTNFTEQEVTAYLDSLGDFIDLKNKNTNPDKFSIDIELSGGKVLSYFEDGMLSRLNTILLLGTNSNNNNLSSCYLSANRQPITEISTGINFVEGMSCGIYAQYISNYYYFYNSEEIQDKELIHKNSNANTLEAQVNYWLSYICDTELSFLVDKVTSTVYKSYYKINNQEYKPQNLGAGISYLIAILTKALLMTKMVQEVFIIENPEIHLHPKSQARLAEFFAFVARTGRQIIIETHSEHLVSKLRYCVYKKQIDSSQVIIQYRQPDKFERIEILPNGKVINEMGEHSFPRGFFDATLDNIFEINSNV